MKILFYTPHVALWPHTVPEAFLARSLKEIGHEIQYFTCGKAQDYCACMSAVRIRAGARRDEYESICRSCVQGAGVLAKQYKFPLDAMSAFLGPEDHAMVESIAADAVARRTLDTRYLDVAVGRLALYEFTLLHKKMSMDLTEGQWLEYGIYLANALRSLLAFSRRIARDRPDVVVAFSPQYSNMNPAMHHAMSLGIRVLFMESGTNLSHRLGTMRVWDWGVHRLVNPALTYWRHSDLNPVSLESGRTVSGHFQYLLGGQHFAVFSSAYKGARDLRALWKIPRNSRVALMTLSSYDEAYAALLIDGFPERKVFSSVFRTQADWVRETLRWVREQDDLFLIIRIHPRDFPNKRDASRSEQSWVLEEILRETPANVHVNWPEEGISLYEIFEETDAIITGWSVTAMEGLALGIPVVTYDRNLPSYPADIMYTGDSPDEFFSNVKAAVQERWSIRNVRNGFRWLAFNFCDCTVNVSSRHGRDEVHGSISRRIVGKFKRTIPSIGKSLDLLPWRDAQEGAAVVDRMLVEGFDAIPPATEAGRRKIDLKIEQQVIDDQLRGLHALLYEGSTLEPEKPGLSRSIRTYLESRGIDG